MVSGDIHLWEARNYYMEYSMEHLCQMLGENDRTLVTLISKLIVASDVGHLRSKWQGKYLR